MWHVFIPWIAMQGVITALISLGILEREAAFFVTAVMMLWLALRPLDEGLAVFIVSFPFFLALPFSEAFDGMASWRILLAVLFLRYLVEQINDYRLKIEDVQSRRSAVQLIIASFTLLLTQLFRSKLFWAAAAFLGWGLMSAMYAPYPFVGIKKLLFLGQIFTLFPIVRYVLSHTGHDRKILTAAAWSVFVIAGIGL